jgi:hypothetical protein
MMKYLSPKDGEGEEENNRRREVVEGRAEVALDRKEQRGKEVPVRSFPN